MSHGFEKEWALSLQKNAWPYFASPEAITDFIRKVTLLARSTDDEEHAESQFPSCRGNQLCGLSKLQEMAQQTQNRAGHQQQRCESWSWRSGLSLKPGYTQSGWCLGSILLMLTSLHKLGALPILFYWSVLLTSILKAHELPMILLVVHISCRPYVWYLLGKAEVKKISIPFEVRDGKSSENDITTSSSVKSSAEVLFDSWLSGMLRTKTLALKILVWSKMENHKMENNTCSRNCTSRYKFT